jgi:hypothetical protein
MVVSMWQPRDSQQERGIFMSVRKRVVTTVPVLAIVCEVVLGMGLLPSGHANSQSR